MTKSILTFLFAVGVSGSACGQVFHLPSPDGWNTETFSIPIEFAPGIKYTGEERLRFAPGWGVVGGSQFWSYSFLWHLNEVVKVKHETLERDIQLYYTGLVTANIAREKKDSTQLIPVSVVFAQSPKDPGDFRTFLGSVRMLDYMGMKPITLNVKVHVFDCDADAGTFILFEVSPQPLVHPVWQDLKAIHDGFRCQK